ncbi:MAG TPA: asparagine synthase (glutamine-hydrolyzing) [Pyrinomonadaceae bacterium]|nr:asparagine synthase (glutamine-hydrolyzing) [Pyrinomonadaceae bacterium]
MCGITGFVRADKGQVAGTADLIGRMCQAIVHRGPDDHGVMIKNGAVLGMRRLSIIDLAGGHQPISGEDGSVTIVYNGEVYNFRELHTLLKSHGHTFQTHSDTEAIVHAYEEFGPACVDHLRGMFAFAIWDDRNQKLFIARDRAGKKPLYYTLTDRGTFVFGSELKSLLVHPEVKRNINLEAVDAYLTLGYVPDPQCIFRDIYKLPPGHHLTFSDNRVVIQKYWDFDFSPDPSMTTEDCVSGLRELLDEAVRLRLVSDVPLGAFLSGGIDSSTVVGLMARHMGQPVKTFSIGFHEDSYNELKYARLTAQKFGTDHHEFFVTPDICDVVDDLVQQLDEPFADPSSIPTYMVSKLAREHVKVVLSGDGGDELFAGYTRYVIDRKRRGFSLLPSVIREGIMQPLSAKLPHGTLGRNYLHNVALDPIHRYLDSVSVFSGLNRQLLYTDDFKKQLGTDGGSLAEFRAYAAQVKTGEPLDQLLFIDSKTYLPGDILTKVDRMSMAVSLEARVPLLDHKLIEFVMRIPSSMKMAGTETKYIFKKAVEDLVPQEILNRPKQGFGMPIEQWINEQLKDRIRDTLHGFRARQRDYVNPDYVNLLLEEHERGRRNHSYALWGLFMLELWHRTFVDQFSNELSYSDAALAVS